jgi:hypothetical protein
MSVSRRRFLATTLGGSATLGFGLSWSSRAHAWGELSDPVAAGPLASAPHPAGGYKVLEIFMYGGVSPWETFYVRGGIADPFFGLDTATADLDWSAACTGIPSPATLTQAFGNDSLGAVRWGPATAPLWRTDIFGRTRMAVQFHNLEPHEAAIPLNLTGHVLGRPNFAGLGAAISHRHSSAAHPLPLSYVFMPDGGATVGDNFQGMTATGTHGGEHKPLLLMMGTSIASISSQLARAGMTPQSDNLLRFYNAQYADKLRWTTGDVVRSKGYSAYNTSLANLLSAPELSTLLSGAPLTPASVAACASFLPAAPSTQLDRTTASIRAAAYLLSQPPASGGARYVGVIDGGMLQSSGAGYDTHGDSVRVQFVNVFNVAAALAEIIDPAATPAPGKISLADTLVILRTEFGRTPVPNSVGRDHWPYGYVNVLIGGPVASRAIAGSIGFTSGTDRGQAIPNSGVATDPKNRFTPSEFHAAVQMAAGIFPFESENFGIGDMSDSTRDGTEELTAANIRTRVLGV